MSSSFRIIGPVLILVLCLAGLEGLAHGQVVSARYAPVIQAIEQEMATYNVPGAAVAIVEGGEVTFARGFGSKHPHYEDPVEASTLFRIGSVTKALTAVGLLQLVDQNAVDLHAPITDYLPDLSFARDANWAPSITVRQLLTYTYERELQPGVLNNFSLLINDMAGFDVYPLPVTFILDSNDQPEYFRTRGFVAAYADAATAPPGSGPGRRSLAQIPNLPPQRIHVQPFLPEPQFPLMRPQKPLGETHVK